MTRLDRLARMKTYASTRSLFSKLNERDLRYITEYLDLHEAVEIGELTAKVNRLFMDGEKPRKHMQIWAILSELCSEEMGERK